MAGSKLTVRASTILEVIVSMVIIIIVFGIAMMIYTNVLRFSPSEKKLRAEAILRDVMSKEQINPVRATRSFTDDEFSIEEEVKTYNGNLSLQEIQLDAYDINKQKIAGIKKILIANE